MNVENTIKKHKIATHINANAIYKKDLDNAMNGPPYYDFATYAYN